MIFDLRPQLSTDPNEVRLFQKLINIISLGTES